ncbi:unnamed protein product [Rhizophagus irregularis]|nr:unnamed protein product [Rhizophagus irregularis]
MEATGTNNIKWTKIPNNNSNKKEDLKHQDIANKYDVGHSTITEILTKKDYFLSIDENSIVSQQKRNRQAFFPQLEETLALWFDEAIKHNLIVTGEILKTKGHAIANILNIDNFNRSDGWLSNFKKRHHIYQITKQDVYNANETALFWDLEPSKTLAHGPMAGTKKSKSRVTVLLLCNALGDKLTPVFIHKHQNPRALKGIKKETLPVYYYWNNKGWMQTSIFQRWLKKLDEDMRKVRQNILLLLDNCSSHVVDESILTNVKVHFFPPNTTSHLQPSYDLYKELKVDKPSLLTIYDAIKFVSKAWNNISKETIIHSWQKTDILPNINSDQLDNEINDEVFKELDQLIRQMPIIDDDMLSIDEYIQYDDNLGIDVMPEIEEIVAAVCYEPNNDENEIENEIEINTNEALESCEKLIKFIQQQDEKFEIDDKLMNGLKKLQKRIQYNKVVSAK